MTMIAPISQNAPSSALRERLHDVDDEELDTLPYGVIALDAEGTIRRYNLAESRFARLDRAQVLGKSFFRQVAKCAATPEFEGRVRKAFDDERAAPFRFDYVFDFRFGAQEVEVEVRRASRELVYLCVSRKRLMQPRAAGVAREPAIAQRELAPDEPRLGVQRDAGERRVVQVAPIFFEGLLTACERTGAPPQLLDEWGFAWGRLAVVEMEAEALERFETLLRDLPMVTVAEFVSAYVRERGWGRASFDFALAQRGAFVVTLERSVLAELPNRSASRRCALLAGFFRAVLEHLAHRRMAVREARCVAQGAPSCELVVVADERARELDLALDGGADSAARALDAMGKASAHGR